MKDVKNDEKFITLGYSHKLLKIPLSKVKIFF